MIELFGWVLYNKNTFDYKKWMDEYHAAWKESHDKRMELEERVNVMQKAIKRHFSIQAGYKGRCKQLERQRNELANRLQLLKSPTYPRVKK